MEYSPKLPPVISGTEELRQAMEEELRTIALAGGNTNVLQLNPQHNEPAKPREGMIVYADGTDWDPGSGEGSYEYDGVDWNKLASGAAPGGDVTPDWVNVMDFGAVGDNVADDTTAIQDAIDYAYTNNIVTVYMPSGNYKITGPIYLDPPNNLRSNFSSPPLFQFALTLTGDLGLGNDTNDGTSIFPTHAGAAIYMGPGNGMMVANLSIRHLSAAYRRKQDVDTIGIGICSGSGGSSRTVIENVNVYGCYTAFLVGANGVNALGDSNTFVKCMAKQVAQGYYFSQTQNFINALYDCQISDCSVGLRADVGTGAHIFGGNWSGGSSAAAAAAITSVSALTDVGHGNYRTWKFTATITSPDSNWDTNLLNMVYDAFCFATSHFGIVPCTLNSFDGSVAEFETTDVWSSFNWGSNNARTVSELELELQACTTVYCCERLKVLVGNHITAQSIHVENPNSATMLISTESGFGSNRPSNLRNVFCNFDPGLNDSRPAQSPSPENLARYYTTKSFGFLEVAQGDLHITDSELGCIDSVLVDVEAAPVFQVDRVRGFFHNIRTLSSPGNEFGPAKHDGAFWSSGIYDHLYFSGNFNFTYDATWRTTNKGASPSIGFRPAPWVTPAIIQTDYTTINGALPAISSSSVSYPLLWGGQIYSVLSYEPGGADYGKRFWSNHSFYSYGQDLTTAEIPSLSWSYRGKSFVVYMNDLSMMFPGLGIILNDGSNDIGYLVTGVYINLGYMTVITQATMPFQSLTSGALNANVTGSVIKQEPYAITVT